MLERPKNIKRSRTGFIDGADCCFQQLGGVSSGMEVATYLDGQVLLLTCLLAFLFRNV